MSVFKCKMCGGTIEFEQGATVGVCDSCGTKQTLPRLDDDRRANLYDRANHFRRNNEFDKAAGIYEQILTEDTTDAEAYWSLVLCQYGIEYVEDPATHKRVPTVNRAQFTSIFDDDNYKSAIQYADGYQRELYEKEAKTINDIQKGILAISQKEEPFDVFICYKETDNNGRRTPDSVLANDLYHQLIQEGFKVFFARITLEDKLGTAYEPYIFAALNSAKVMVVLGTKPEHFNAVWVKNEWSRYLALVKNSGGKKILIPAYKDMDPYDLPDEFSHLQAQDMSKLGFMQDLIRGIKKIVHTDEPKATVKETVVVSGGNANIAPFLKRAFMFLEDKNWDDANEYCEKVLDQDPENAEAYLGKLMAQLKVSTREKLKDCEQPFDGLSDYKKVIRFGDENVKSELRGYLDFIAERNENARLTDIYNSAVNAMNAANSEAGYKMAAEMFKPIFGFKDADSLVEQCLDKAETCRKDAVYTAAKSRMTGNEVSGYAMAINTFRTISGWKDADVQVIACEKKIEEIKTKEESDRAKAEERRIAAENTAKKRKVVVLIVSSIAAACIAFVIVLITIIIPNKLYNNALREYESGEYSEALRLFKSISWYKNSKEYTYIEIDEDNAVVSYIGSDSNISLPNGVTSIGENAFRNCDSLVSITIPDSVITISENAFRDCKNLASITIPDSVTVISDNAFRNCSKLASIAIPDSVTSIGTYAFNDCVSLLSMSIPKGVKTISDYAFSGCSKLSSVEIPDNVTIIRSYAFYNCATLTSIKIPKGVYTIGNYAFSGCVKLSSVEIPESVTTIGAHAFYNCISLPLIIIPKEVKTIDDYTFCKCYKLSSVEVPDSVTRIGRFAFSECGELSSISIPKGTNTIGDYAFSGCDKLSSVKLPDSITSISNSAFEGCSGLTVYYRGSQKQWESLLGISNGFSVSVYTAWRNIKVVYNYK